MIGRASDVCAGKSDLSVFSQLAAEYIRSLRAELVPKPVDTKPEKKKGGKKKRPQLREELQKHHQVPLELNAVQWRLSIWMGRI